jgi:hypothetical protein
MNQKSSLPQSAKSVSEVLTPDSQQLTRSGLGSTRKVKRLRRQGWTPNWSSADTAGRFQIMSAAALFAGNADESDIRGVSVMAVTYQTLIVGDVQVFYREAGLATAPVVLLMRFSGTRFELRDTRTCRVSR